MATKRSDTGATLLRLALFSFGISVIAAFQEGGYHVLGEAGLANTPEIALAGSQHYRSNQRVRRDVMEPSTSTATTTTTASSPGGSPSSSTTPSPSPSPSTSPSPAPVTSTTPAPVTSTTPPPPPTTTTRKQPTVVEDMDHLYYMSSTFFGQEAVEYWLSEEQLSGLGAEVHASLSSNHRVAATKELTFSFPFYGHPVKKVTIATGGFLYMSDFLHQWLTATQYIAPLMANFDTNIGNVSQVHYAEEPGNFFVVWWEDVHLQDMPEAGPFSFQVIIHHDGEIIFNYKRVGIDVSKIPKGQHPVKIGLSDAYYVDTTTPANTRRRTIYEYHRLEVGSESIRNFSTVVIVPLPTCVQQKDCRSCLGDVNNFQCEYCTTLERCSDGFDRHRQDWVDNGCLLENSTLTSCPGRPFGGLGIGGLIVILLIIVAIIALVSVGFYAYRNPQTKLGVWMIEHRPSQLRQQLSNVRFFKRNEGAAADKYEVSIPEGADSTA